MAKEYIEREAVIRTLFAEYGSVASQDVLWQLTETIRRVTAADVRPVVYAHLEIANKTYDEDGMARWRCSNCKNYRWFGKKPTHIKICEECGADMREVDDG